MIMITYVAIMLLCASKLVIAKIEKSYEMGK